MTEGKTKTGFEFSINEKALQDWEYMEHLRKVQDLSKKKNPDPIEAFREFDWMLTFLLGSKEKERLLGHVKERNEGFAPLDAVMSEWRDIVSSSKIKNSQSSPD